MPNELEDILKTYESNKKKIDYIKGLSQSSLNKLNKQTREDIKKQIKLFEDSEKDLIRRGIIEAPKEAPMLEEPKSFQESVERGLDNISYKGKDMGGQTELSSIKDIKVNKPMTKREALGQASKNLGKMEKTIKGGISELDKQEKDITEAIQKAKDILSEKFSMSELYEMGFD
tara:strand:- start:24574 stop:25092 length:519 start_codon:yes stop_codon:yes gene_type:complete